MSIWTDLLFLHGHIGNAPLARSLAAAPPAAPPADAGDALRGGQEEPHPASPCPPTLPARGVASLCAVALSQFR
jgi:hypothetical protein